MLGDDDDAGSMMRFVNLPPRLIKPMRPPAAFSPPALLRLSPRAPARHRTTMASAGRYALLLLPFLPLLLALARTQPSDAVASPRRLSAVAASAAGRHVIVYSTAPSADVASKVASALVNARLAACVSTVPGVTSTYWWEGKVETGQEHLLMIKTRAELVEELTKKVTEIHPFDTPEVVALPIVGGLGKYLEWIDQSTKEPGEAKKK